MKKFIALIMAFAVIQIQAITKTEQIEQIHQICIPFIIKHEINEKQLSPSEDEYTESVKRAIEYYQEKFDNRSAEEKKDFFKTFNFKTIKNLQKTLIFLYDKESAEIIFTYLHHSVQEHIAQIAMIVQALAAIKEGTSYAEYVYNMTISNKNTLESTEPEKIEQAIKMIISPNQGQDAFFNKIILEIFQPTA